jgi:hypothetical protein
LSGDHPGQDLNVYRRDQTVVRAGQFPFGQLFDEALVAIELFGFGDDAEDGGGLFGAEFLQAEFLLRPERIAHRFLQFAQVIEKIAADADQDFDGQPAPVAIPLVQFADERAATAFAFEMDEELFELIEQQDERFGVRLRNAREQSRKRSVRWRRRLV